MASSHRGEASAVGGGGRGAFVHASSGSLLEAAVETCL